MKCRRDEVIVNCPQCGRESPVTRGMKLAMCWRCAMGAADEVEAERIRDLSAFDWPETIQRIRGANEWSQKDVARSLRLNPNQLTAIKGGKRPMPAKALELIKEKHPEHIVRTEQKLT
jgi:hypothetical protein